jgi:hypothetical protein
VQDKTLFLRNPQILTIEQEDEWWAKLQALSDNDDVKGFFLLYEKYLKDHGLISSHRITIYKMIKLLNEEYHEPEHCA